MLEDETIVIDQSAMEEQVNLTLDNAIELLQEELERLTVALETCRRLDHPRRAELVRWHVRRVDQRQDALDKLQAMLLADREPGTQIH